MKIFKSQIYFCIENLLLIEVTFLLIYCFCLKQLIFWLNYKYTNVLPIIWPKQKNSITSIEKLLPTKKPSLLKKIESIFNQRKPLFKCFSFFCLSYIFVFTNLFLWGKRVFLIEVTFFFFIKNIFWLTQIKDKKKDISILRL